MGDPSARVFEVFLIVSQSVPINFGRGVARAVYRLVSQSVSSSMVFFRWLDDGPSGKSPLDDDPRPVFDRVRVLGSVL